MLPVAALIVLIITSLRQVPSVIAEKNRHIIFTLFATLAGLVAFLAMPYHIEYLIPIIPFVLVFIFRIGKKWLLIPLTLLTISHAFVNIVSIQHIGHGQVRTNLIETGTVVRNITERKHQLAFVQDLMQTRIPDHSVVIIGTWLPVLAYLDEDVSSVMDTKKMYDTNRPDAGIQDFHRDVLYRYLLTPSELKEFLEQNYTVYYIDGIREFTITVHGYDLADYPTICLDV